MQRNRPGETRPYDQMFLKGIGDTARVVHPTIGRLRVELSKTYGEIMTKGIYDIKLPLSR